MDIHSMLNPDTQEPSPRRHPSHHHHHHHHRRKQSADNPQDYDVELRGIVRYPPQVPDDQSLLASLRDFCVQPISDIQKFPRHIPYSSDKKGFLQKTGRGAFETFQYTFKFSYEASVDSAERYAAHEDDPSWIVMWDYEIGLVRITPFFKCFDYQKTVPAKAINLNEGLMELCHSITGGAITAQGYWMPFDSARALAATFCWQIRFALVPIFGCEFVTACIHPTSPDFKKFVIDGHIVAQSRLQVAGWTSPLSPTYTRRPPANLVAGSTSKLSPVPDIDLQPTKFLRPRKVKTYREMDDASDHESIVESTNGDNVSVQINTSSATVLPSLKVCPMVLESQLENGETSSPIIAHRMKRSVSDVRESEATCFAVGMMESENQMEKRRRLDNWSSEEERVALVLTNLRFPREKCTKRR